MRIFFAVIALLLPTVTMAQGADGLVAHWDFNGSINDVSGNGNDGINYGTVPTAGVTGAPNTARYFDGVDDHIDVPYATQLDLENFTILAYVKIHSFYSGTCQGNYIVSKGYEFSGNFYMLAYGDNATDGSCTAYDPTVARFYTATNGTSAPYGTEYWANGGINPIIDTGTWYCIASSYNGDTAKGYVNGVLVANTPWTNQYTGAVNSGMGIGYHRYGLPNYPYWIHADIDDIRLYNRALTQAEIATYCDSVTFVPTAPLPTGSLNGSSVCPGQEAFLVFNATEGTAPFNLTLAAGTDTFSVPGVESGVPFSVGFPDATTTYTLISISDAAGGLSTASATTATVTVFPPAFADAGPDTTLCGAGSVTLSGSGGGTYLWTPAAGLSNPNIASPIATVEETSTYVLEVTTANGCTDKDSVIINVVQPGSFMVDSLVNICPGDSAQLFAFGGDQYLWTPATGLSDPTSATPWANPQSTTTYQVAITSHLCNQSDTLTVQVNRRGFPTIEALSSNDLDCGQPFAQLAATGALTYLWTPPIGVESATTATTIVRPDTTTTYTVYGTDAFGCTGHTDVTVKVLQDGQSRVLTPTAFTPNNDGINDCWKVVLPGYTTDYQLLIFNRWGQEVFSTTDINACWDGSFHGVIQPVGTFVYYFKGKNSYCGKVEGKGNFHLLR